MPAVSRRRSPDPSQLEALVTPLQLACRRQLGLDLFPVQLSAGRAMSAGQIAEMETGEGKTLAALLPLLAFGSRGGAWLATANDYLAQRDADLLSSIFAEFGLEVGCITSGQSPEQRRIHYQRPIVYGTLREFGFDLLRHSLGRRSPGGASWGGADAREFELPSLLLVDEADSLLIDEASTPLIISRQLEGASREERAGHQLGAQLASNLRPGEDYRRDERSGQHTLTPGGRIRILQGVFPAELQDSPVSRVYGWVEQALDCNATFQRDVHYVVRDQKVRIVDEGTGRIGADRQWQGGLHQAVEAREGIPITGQTSPAARITVQDLVQQFPLRGGMTGTARECTRELWGVYGLGVAAIPTRLPSRRRIEPPVVCRSTEDKWRRVVADIAQVLAEGRAVLVGTRSVRASEELSHHLRAIGIEHELLNARRPEREAEIIAQAGLPGKLTVATNMAGRGTDIRLDPAVRERGGLHVIGTELHSSARIDRQLAGRCGRQGDPGSFRQFVSPGDTLLEQAAIRLGRTHRTPRNYQGYLAIQKQIEAADQQTRIVLMLRERERRERLTVLGLDPLLDLLEE